SVLVASTDGTVARVGVDGRALASADLGAPIESTPAVDVDGTVWVATRTGVVVAFDRDLHERSRITVEGPVTGALLLDDDGTVYVPGRGLHAIDLRGRLRFTATRAVPLRGCASRLDDGRLVFGTPEGTVVALSRDGTVAWETNVEASVDGCIAITDDGR